jgi:hypothetical protein
MFDPVCAMSDGTKRVKAPSEIGNFYGKIEIEFLAQVDRLKSPVSEYVSLSTKSQVLMGF